MNARRVVVCAMASEAEALIAHWGLRPRRERPFRLFGDEQCHVVISGLGSHACATAVGFAAAVLDAGPADAWINFGIAGHRELPLGTALIAARVAHHGRDEAWYPRLAPSLPCATAAVLSHDHVVDDYPPWACVDMEASGFMAAATRFARSHDVQVMKVVSDNAAHGASRVTRAQVEDLSRAALPSLLALLDATLTHEPPPLDPRSQATLDAALTRWHFTESQRAQLLQACQRLHAQRAPLPALDGRLGARDVLACLRDAVDGLTAR